MIVEMTNWHAAAAAVGLVLGGLCLIAWGFAKLMGRHRRTRIMTIDAAALAKIREIAEQAP